MLYLKEYESLGETVREFCERYSISRPTFYYWKNDLINKNTNELVKQTQVGLVQFEIAVFQKKTLKTIQITSKKSRMEILLPVGSSVEDVKNVFDALSAV